MKATTDKIRHALVRLGDRMGFVSQRELTDSLLALRVSGAYQPRIDLMWSLPLDEAKRQVIAEVTGSRNAESAVLGATRDTLLPRLLSGELSVAGAERVLETRA